VSVEVDRLARGVRQPIAAILTLLSVERVLHVRLVFFDAAVQRVRRKISVSRDVRDSICDRVHLRLWVDGPSRR
jgi:hypothetical protein